MSESRIARPLSVLVADSDADFKKAAAEALARGGFTVELAGTPEEAFDKMRALAPELLFYDLDLPGYDGLEAVTLISKMRSARRGFIVACSKCAAEEIDAEALSAGAWDFAAGPVSIDALVETARAVKRHLRRPRRLVHKAVNKSLKAVTRKCARQGCGASVTAFLLRGSPMVEETDQFETRIYRKATPRHEFVDYNLVSVSVCPACYFAADEAASPAQAGPEADRAALGRPRGVPQARLFSIAAEADDTLFSEDRSPQAAVVALRLAIVNLESWASRDSPEDQALLADLVLKAAAVSHTLGDERLRDRFLADAEEICAAAVELEARAQTYRAAYRLVALYTFFARDMDAARVLRLFGRFARPREGRMRPRDSRILDNYRGKAARLIADRNRHRRANYLAD